MKKKNLVKQFVVKKNWSKKHWFKRILVSNNFGRKKMYSKLFGDFYKDFGSPLPEA